MVVLDKAVADNTELLTVAEVALRLKVTPTTVLRWIRDKRLPATMPGGKPDGLSSASRRSRRVHHRSLRMTEVEDVWAIVHERDGLRAKVRKLEAENRQLRTIVAGYTDQARLKPEDVSTPHTPRRRRMKDDAIN